MSRPGKEPPVLSSLPPAILRHLRANGHDATLFALRAGLPADAETMDDVRAAVGVTEDLLAAAAEALGDPCLALALPTALAFPRYRFGELSARASATLREGLSRFLRYLPLVIPGVVGEIRDEGTELLVCVRTPGRARGLGRHAHEYALALALNYARRETTRSVAATRAWFAHARPRDIAPLYRFFAARDLQFGAEDSGFALPRADGDLALVGGDERLVATVEPLAEAELRAVATTGGIEKLVAARIETMLPNASIEAVAASLHMSPRTLQRRLEDEGTRFTETVDAVRTVLARRWVADPNIALVEVAERLGFADLASFGRAFKRWTGRSPGMFRRTESTSGPTPKG